MWFVYLLKSDQADWYYVGSTNNTKIRLNEHNKGKVHSTKGYLPLKLVYVESFSQESQARKREREIKARRIVKEQIISSIEK